jgi:hypothetical protein
MASDINLHANSVVGSQDTINCGIRDLSNSDSTSHFTFRSSVSVITQSASVDYLKPSTVAFLSACVRIPCVKRSNVTSLPLSINAQRILHMAAKSSSSVGNADSTCHPSPALLLSLSEICSVTVTWREYSVGEGITELMSSQRASADIMNGIRNAHNKFGTLDDGMSWIRNSEERMRCHKDRQKTFMNPPQAGSSKETRYPSHKKRESFNR